MIVLSLFDGISCARVALDRAKIPVSKYYSAEIDKNAIKISEKNYPDIIRLGDVREIHSLPEPIDLLIGGSPCQDLSIAKKDRKGLEGDRSGLFWEYVRILRELKPKWFILENVASMPKKDKDTITQELGVEPVMFDAGLVSAQCRRRLFWTNIKFELPEDRGILLKHILQPDAEVGEDMTMRSKSFSPLPKPKEHEFVQIGYFGASNACGVGGQALRVYSDEGKSTTSGVGLYKIGHVGDKEHQANRVYSPEGKAPTQCKGPNGGATPTLIKVGHIGNTDGQANRVYSPDGKSATLSANGGGSGAKTGLYAIGRDIGRRLNANGIRADHDTSLPYERRIELRDDEKAGTLTSVQKDNQVVDLTNMRIRKLTPIECERLQGLPDNYTEGVAKTHRYKCLGNAFNADVIAHILLSLHQMNSRTPGQ